MSQNLRGASRRPDCYIPHAKRMNFCGCFVDPVAEGGSYAGAFMRQSDETIIIGDNIRVTIVEVRGDKVRIGFYAPRDVTVHRQEIYDAIRREDKPAQERSRTVHRDFHRIILMRNLYRQPSGNDFPKAACIFALVIAKVSTDDLICKSLWCSEPAKTGRHHIA